MQGPSKPIDQPNINIGPAMDISSRLGERFILYEKSTISRLPKTYGVCLLRMNKTPRGLYNNTKK